MMASFKMSDELWTRISTMKHLCSDDYGMRWKSTPMFNCFLTNLPWYVLDRNLNTNILLYQVESSGELHMLGILFLVRIRTFRSGFEILYKSDMRHARLETFHVPRWHLNRVGAISIRAPCAPDDESSPPSLL